MPSSLGPKGNDDVLPAQQTPLWLGSRSQQPPVAVPNAATSTARSSARRPDGPGVGGYAFGVPKGDRAKVSIN